MLKSLGTIYLGRVHLNQPLQPLEQKIFSGKINFIDLMQMVLQLKILFIMTNQPSKFKRNPILMSGDIVDVNEVFLAQQILLFLKLQDHSLILMGYTNYL